MIKKSIDYLRTFDKNLWILSLGWFVGTMGFAVSIPFISIYFHSELGFSIAEIGIFFGVMAIVRSVFQLIGGELSDKVERRMLLVYTQILRALMFGALAVSIYYSWGFWPIATFMFLNSIFGAFFHPAAYAMVSDILPKDKRLDGYAITRSMGNLGWAAGPALGGFLANHSYSLLFLISTVITFLSGVVFWVFLKSPQIYQIDERFKLKDLIAIKDDPYLARHSILIFFLYLVVAQLIAPFSVYAVDIVGISENQLGVLYTINGLMVASLQIPVTKLLAKMKLTHQLALGSLIYAIGYSLVGTFVGFNYFVIAMIVVTLGEVVMSPPSLALTSHLAPEGRMGRYMGIFSFFVASGWSFGPLYGGFILDQYAHAPATAWIFISSIALLAAGGYMYFTRKLPLKYNIKN